MNRRQFALSIAASLASAAQKLPANQNVKWAVSSALWNHFAKVPFTDILDVMHDTGFIGVRMTQFPQILKTYDMTVAQMEKELSKRNLHIATISFNGPAHDPARQAKVLADAKTAMEFLKIFAADRLVVFSPGRVPAGQDVDAAFKTMCETYNHIGELAGTMGFKAGLHNHLNQMCESQAEIDKCLATTDPKLFYFSPDTAHLQLAGCNVVDNFKKYKNRLMLADYKDAKWTAPAADLVLTNGKTYTKDSKDAKFFNSIYDLGDGEVDFPGCHRVLKEIGYKGWICVDLDAARNGPRASYERCGAYVVNKLEPIYK